MKTSHKLLIPFICTLPLIGCGGSGGSGQATELEGSWKLGCNYDFEDERYDTESFAISGSSYAFEASGSDYDDCSIPRFSVRERGSLLIGEEMILNSGITVKKLDVTPNEVFVTLSADELVVYNNNNTTCGRSNWQKDIEVDVSNCAALNLTATKYDIYTIDGNNAFLGDNDFGDGSSESSRPTQLEDKFYSKL